MHRFETRIYRASLGLLLALGISCYSYEPASLDPVDGDLGLLLFYQALLAPSTTNTSSTSCPSGSTQTLTVQGSTAGGTASSNFFVPSGTTCVQISSLSLAGDFASSTENATVYADFLTSTCNLGTASSGVDGTTLIVDSSFTNRTIPTSCWSAGTTLTMFYSASADVNFDPGGGYFYRYSTTLNYGTVTSSSVHRVRYTNTSGVTTVAALFTSAGCSAASMVTGSSATVFNNSTSSYLSVSPGTYYVGDKPSGTQFCVNTSRTYAAGSSTTITVTASTYSFSSP